MFLKAVGESPQTGALWARKRGFRVFPIVENGKIPAVKNWQQWAEDSTKEKIKNFGEKYNWGIYCGASDLTVIDIDLKNNKSEQDVYKELVPDLKELPNTLTVRTPSKGIHRYYSGLMRSSISKICKNVDIKSIGGYVVCPGSRIKENTYTIIDNPDTVADIPKWFKDLSNQKSKPEIPEGDLLVERGQRNQTLTSLAGAMRTRGMGYTAILSALSEMNENQTSSPLPIHEIKIIAQSVASYKPEMAEVSILFNKVEKTKLKKSSEIDPNPPLRDWIMQNRYIGGFISLIIAPGGIGKSTLTLLDGASVSTGKALSGFDVIKKGAVWIYNTEDPLEELERRILALAKHHNLKLEDLNNLFITSGRDQPLIMAKLGKNKTIEVNKEAITNMVDNIKEHDIKLLIVDPFVRTHEVSENDNMQIDKVLWCFQQVAERTSCAIGLVHHTSKAAKSMDDNDPNMARGASALVNASRIAHTLIPMKEKEAKDFGLAETNKNWHVKLNDAKANLQPPTDKANWFKKISVTLANGEQVGTMEKTKLEAQAQTGSITAEYKDLLSVLPEYFNGSDKMTVTSLAKKILDDKEKTHLFKGKSMNTISKYLKKAIGAGIEINDEKYSCSEENIEGENGKHFIRVSRFQKRP